MGQEQIERVLKIAEQLYKDRRQKRLLRFLNEERLSALSDARLYKLRGMALRRIRGSRKEAISAFSIAIKLNQNDASLYRERGITYRLMSNLKKALKDHTTAIRIDPKDADLCITRADTWRALRKFKEAKKDFATAIALSPKDPKAYYHRANLWRQLRNKTVEIKDYIKALELDAGASADKYGHLGDLYYEAKKYDLAFKQYNLAIDLDPGVDLWKVDYTLVNIFNAIASVSDSQRKAIYEACIPVSDLLSTIRDFTDHSITDDYETLDESVVHFTKLSVADILLSSDNNKFRFYHISYMNDPEEGKILFEILKDPHIQESYNNGGLNEESNFYLGSFLPVSHADELVMWRTYGKDEQDSEARGCSIIIDREFFDEEPEDIHAKPEDQPEPKTKKDGEKTEAKTRYNTSLHKVIYYNRDKKEILGSDGPEITKELKKLRTRLNEVISFKDSAVKNSPLNQAIDSIVYYVITELQYYFKSSDYSYENEERVILFVPPKSQLVKIEDGTTLPKRLYVEAKKPIRKHIKKVVLGPRVVHPDRWIYLKVKMTKDRNEIELKKSSCKFQ